MTSRNATRMHCAAAYKDTWMGSVETLWASCGPGPKQTPSAFGADLDKETDPEFWTFSFISKGDKCTILIITIRCIKVAEWARAKYWTIWFQQWWYSAQPSYLKKIIKLCQQNWHYDLEAQLFSCADCNAHSRVSEGFNRLYNNTMK